jgi:UDP-N-acetylglucosamine:LPS N-acetylglucosamine transferase
LEEKNKTITIIRWRNKKLYTLLEKKYKNHPNITCADFIDLKYYLKTQDIFIGKPGWAITSECIATDTPLIVPHFTPWQEEWNIQLLKEYTIWLYEPDPYNTAFIVTYCNFTPLLSFFQKIKKPDANQRIVEKIMNLMNDSE